jgi:hypothetical protein
LRCSRRSSSTRADRPVQLQARHSAIDCRTTRHAGDAASQTFRKKIEEPFGWAKTIGDMAHTMYRGVERVRAGSP